MVPDTVTMDKIVSLCKRRGFVFPTSEIYGGHRLELRLRPLRRPAQEQRQGGSGGARSLQERDDVVALDSAIIQHPRTWEASGHVAGFTDPLVDCRTCKLRFRADKLEDGRCGRKPSQAPRRRPPSAT